jgi:CHASE2 domain-containing sensor protein
LFLLILVAVVYTVYERVAILQQMEQVARDFQAQLRPPRTSTDVAVVLITDTDYAAFFGNASPLDPDAMGALLQAIAAGGPRVIAVDLATDGLGYAGLVHLLGDVPVVWARESVDCDGPFAVPAACRTGQASALLSFAGAAQPGSTFGLVQMQRDSDGAIRRYRMTLPVNDTIRPTFAEAVLSAADLSRSEGSDERFIRYQPLPPGAVHTAALVSDAAKSPDFTERGFLKDRIVLLGGAYRAARDRHQTPIGELSGVEIQAQVVLTELEGGGLRPVGIDTIGLLLLVNSVALLVLFQWTSLRLAFWLSLLAVPVLGTASSLIVAGSPFALWPYVVPVLVAVLLQQLYSQAMRYRNALIRGWGSNLKSRLKSRGVSLWPQWRSQDH